MHYQPEIQEYSLPTNELRWIRRQYLGDSEGLGFRLDEKTWGVLQQRWDTFRVVNSIRENVGHEWRDVPGADE